MPPRGFWSRGLSQGHTLSSSIHSEEGGVRLSASSRLVTGVENHDVPVREQAREAPSPDTPAATGSYRYNPAAGPSNLAAFGYLNQF
jgi:hypothetical protein